MFTTLTRRVAADEDAAKEQFEALLRATYRQAYSLAFRLAGNASEAEDLVQETYVRAYRFFHRYNEELPFANWIYRIMCNAHIDSVRRRGRIKTTSLEHVGPNGATTWDLPDPEGSPDRELMSRSMDEHVQASLLEMNGEFRTAVLLADVEGLAYEDIAAIMGTSVGTVRSRIHRGRKQLRRLLTQRSPKAYGGSTDEL